MRDDFVYYVCMVEKGRLKLWTKRLDRAVLVQHPERSRNFWQRCIRDGAVLVNGRSVKKPHFLVKESDCISLKSGACVEKNAEPAPREAIPHTLFESSSFFVLDKPAGVRTEQLTKGFFAVHRLDKDTSGVLVVAKTAKAQVALQAQWQERKVQKTYLALIKGHLEPREGAIDGSILRSFKDRKKMALSGHKRARAAYTEYRVIRYFGEKGVDGATSLLRAFPTTGRTHQIRVHFASIGHPLLGDKIYGVKALNEKFEEDFGLQRQFLHAEKLTLLNPETGKKVSFEAKLPQDLNSVLEKLKP